MERILFSYFPSGISKEDLAKNMQNLFASHNTKGSRRYLKALIFKSVLILRHILINVEKYITNIFIDQKVLDDDDNANVHVSDEHIRKIVKEVLRIYDADKTGQVDYALETAGIVSFR